MENNQDQKWIKRIQKEITRLKVEFKKIELRPCHGDEDLKKKNEELISLKKEIYELEKAANQLSIYMSSMGKER